MDAIIRGFVETLVLGEPKCIGGFTVVPLYRGVATTLDYTALQTAIASQFVQVKEVDAAGSVGELLISNSGGCLVLGVEGEELTGAKQNRILNTSILLQNGTRTVIPVSCTEQGRWSNVSVEMSPSDSFATPRIRENAKRSVNRSLAEHRGFRTNQAEVWDRVSRFASSSGVHSPTSALNDVVKSRMSQFGGTAASIPAQPAQCGLLVIANGRVLGFDVVSRPEVYAALHERLLRGYLVDDAPAPPADTREPATLATQYLQRTLTARERRFPSVGMGEDYRYDGEALVGSALVAQGQVAHMAFFSSTGDERDV